MEAGFRLWAVSDMDEGENWVKRSPKPMRDPGEIEIRLPFEPSDFAEAMAPEQVER